MQVKFLLRFSTHFGQNLYISGNHDVLGSSEISNAVPLHYINEEFWGIDLNISPSDSLSVLNYKYILKNPDGFVVVEWGDDRSLSLIVNETSLTIIDTWNHAGSFENAFFTDPFRNVLLERKARENYSNALNSTGNFLFKVKAPLLKKNEIVCLIGNSAEIGSWNVTNPILMEFDGHWWCQSVNIFHSAPALSYKYGIYDPIQAKFIKFEDGPNRNIQLMKATAKTILNDGFAHFPNDSWKGAGVAIPVFSLRTEKSFGVGEFNDIKMLTDWSHQVGLKMIQLLPVNDTTATHSWQDSYPYAAISAFALHPLFINLASVANSKTDLLSQFENQRLELNQATVVDYEGVMKVKMEALRLLFKEDKESCFKKKDYKEFFQENKHWLQPYAAFCYLRDLNGTPDFNQWSSHSIFNMAEVEALSEKGKDSATEIGFQYFIQYHLHLQLKQATAYAHEKGLIVKGDIPIGIYRYSVDAWMEPDLYHMEMQAGAPPDDFALQGQNWGFPTYNWDRMSQDGYQWWYKRFVQMGNYFDAFRIDHILGFFRIWSIPLHATEGIMGNFVPALPVHITEFSRKHISFDIHRYCQPYITDFVLEELFGDRKGVLMEFLYQKHPGIYEVKENFNTQRKVENHFSSATENDHLFIAQSLKDLLSNVILLEVEGSHGQQFHFRFNMEKTTSFKYLDTYIQSQLRELYVDYFFRRQDDFWKKQAMNKLPALKRSTNMLICGEDLGLVPGCVPDVMNQLGILSLEIQRMPKALGKEFFHPDHAPYLSVVTPSTHDMSTIRGWWEEDKQKTQRFYNSELGQWGEAPAHCEPWISRAIIRQHLFSPAMWSVFQLQDLMGMSDVFRREDFEEERINIPANPKHYWQYRMHLSLENLMQQKDFTTLLADMISSSGRN